MSKSTNFSTVLTEAAKAIGLAVLVNIVFYYILNAVGIFSENPDMSPDGQKLNVIPVAISTVFFMVIGTVIFLLLVRFSSNPGKIFTYFCIGGFILTLGNPFFAGLPTKFGIGLDLLHIAPAYLLWRFLTRTVA
jgi:hypothetical protein